jgi:hypothetical protein
LRASAGLVACYGRPEQQIQVIHADAYIPRRCSAV